VKKLFNWIPGGDEEENEDEDGKKKKKKKKSFWKRVKKFLKWSAI